MRGTPQQPQRRVADAEVPRDRPGAVDGNEQSVQVAVVVHRYVLRAARADRAHSRRRHARSARSVRLPSWRQHQAIASSARATKIARVMPRSPSRDSARSRTGRPSRAGRTGDTARSRRGSPCRAAPETLARDRGRPPRAPRGRPVRRRRSGSRVDRAGDRSRRTGRPRVHSRDPGRAPRSGSSVDPREGQREDDGAGRGEQESQSLCGDAAAHGPSSSRRIERAST